MSLEICQRRRRFQIKPSKEMPRQNQTSSMCRKQIQGSQTQFRCEEDKLNSDKLMHPTISCPEILNTVLELYRSFSNSKCQKAV